MSAWVYMLRCSDGSYYVGSTTDIERRVSEHQEGIGAAYTRRRRPVELVWSEWHSSVAEAYFSEKRIQNWSRTKREALIRGDSAALSRLASRRTRLATARDLKAGIEPTDQGVSSEDGLPF